MKPLLYLGSKTIILIFITFLVNCKGYDSSIPSSGTNNSPQDVFGVGQGGSLSRFSIKDNYLYAVDDKKLLTFLIENPQNIQNKNVKEVGERIQTLYNFKDKLFIGSENSSYYYDISNQSNPVYISKLLHSWSCDPVVADDTIAYVTLSLTPRRCRVGLRQLDVISIKNIQTPTLKKTYQMSNPIGMALTKDFLFVCDNSVKIFKRNGYSLDSISQTNFIEAQDIILKDSLAIISTKKNIFIYKFKNDSLTKISKL